MSKIDRKKELKEKVDEQNSIIKKYMEKQKEQFDEYFAKLKEKNAWYYLLILIWNKIAFS